MSILKDHFLWEMYKFRERWHSRLALIENDGNTHSVKVLTGCIPFYKMLLLHFRSKIMIWCFGAILDQFYNEHFK